MRNYTTWVLIKGELILFFISRSNFVVTLYIQISWCNIYVMFWPFSFKITDLKCFLKCLFSKISSSTTSIQQFSLVWRLFKKLSLMILSTHKYTFALVNYPCKCLISYFFVFESHFFQFSSFFSSCLIPPCLSLFTTIFFNALLLTAFPSLVTHGLTSAKNSAPLAKIWNRL